ncbi:unnamed protein product [Polarella glacialis]|uniref:Uncharacterized protein n=1 Tax=Polarella glacialis TaxID=89957 RepID=A0A813HMB2_POLGL|nr:unnamed protein product [Polarella glacialis]
MQNMEIRHVVVGTNRRSQSAACCAVSRPSACCTWPMSTLKCCTHIIAGVRHRGVGAAGVVAGRERLLSVRSCVAGRERLLSVRSSVGCNRGGNGRSGPSP